MERCVFLSVAEAVEFRHGAFHFFASGVGRGADTLNAEAEVVRVGSAHESFFKSDEIARIEIEERLVESLHAVLAGAGGDGVANHARFVRIDDAIADVAGADHYFNGWDAAAAVGFTHESLAHARLCRSAKLHADLFF